MVIISLQGASELQSLFGLPPEEELLEGFHCMLAQTYACTYNTFSRAREVTHYLSSTLLFVRIGCNAVV